jgi:hypothetical protein
MVNEQYLHLHKTERSKFSYTTEILLIRILPALYHVVITKEPWIDYKNSKLH